VQVSGILEQGHRASGVARALRLDSEAGPNRPSLALSNSALLRPLRTRTTCENAGLHSGERVIADKTGMAGGRHEG
jgi:hypothetical protein